MSNITLFAVAALFGGIVGGCNAEAAERGPMSATFDDGSVVTIYPEAGPCVGAAKRAVWSSADGQKQVPGCWVLVGDMVLTVYFDAESSQSRLDKFQPAKVM